MKILFGLIAMLIGVTLLFPGGAPGGGVSLPELPRGKGETCVEPTEVMRKDHFEFLDHQRDATVRNGIRGSKHSLVGCVQCHVQQDSRGEFISVDAPGQFCASCHQFTAVEPDCFECHATVPDAPGGHLEARR